MASPSEKAATDCKADVMKEITLDSPFPVGEARAVLTGSVNNKGVVVYTYDVFVNGVWVGSVDMKAEGSELKWRVK